MSGTLMGMTGLGANGMGMGGNSGTISPQIMQMLMQMRGAGAPQLTAPQPPQVGNPMVLPPQPAAPPTGAQVPGIQGAMSQFPGLLAALGGGQQGITPQAGPGAPQAQAYGPPAPGQTQMGPSGIPLAPNNGTNLPFNAQGQQQMQPGMAQFIMNLFRGQQPPQG